MTTATINAQGIGGFYSDIRVEEEQRWTAEVPDIAVEDGTYIHDNIINKPLEVRINGLIGLQHISGVVDDIFASHFEKADTLTAFLPNDSEFAIQQIRALVVNKVSEAKSYFEKFNNVFQNINVNRTDLMQSFNDFMREVIDKKTLLDIKMPFNDYRNMAIISYTCRTDNQENQISYEITAKEIILASNFRPANTLENAFNKGKSAVNKGVVSLQKTTRTPSELL
jgi:hypothetical protein